MAFSENDRMNAVLAQFGSMRLNAAVAAARYKPPGTGQVVISRYRVQEEAARFDPRFVILRTMQIKDMNALLRMNDVPKMIQIYVERGTNNIAKIENSRPPLIVRELKRLKSTYNLVSMARHSKAITLSRVCESFPRITCSYMMVARNPIVPFRRMYNVSADYPKVMATSAFAYIIPNKHQEFCLLLKMAHMVFEYEFIATITGRHHAYGYVENFYYPDIVSQCILYTNAAIVRSHLSYDMQIAFLKKYDLIDVKDDGITVTKRVRDAAQVWNGIMSRQTFRYEI